MDLAGATRAGPQPTRSVCPKWRRCQCDSIPDWKRPPHAADVRADDQHAGGVVAEEARWGQHVLATRRRGLHRLAAASDISPSICRARAWRTDRGNAFCVSWAAVREAVGDGEPDAAPNQRHELVWSEPLPRVRPTGLDSGRGASPADSPGQRVLTMGGIPAFRTSTFASRCDRRRMTRPASTPGRDGELHLSSSFTTCVQRSRCVSSAARVGGCISRAARNACRRSPRYASARRAARARRDPRCRRRRRRTSRCRARPFDGLTAHAQHAAVHRQTSSFWISMCCCHCEPPYCERRAMSDAHFGARSRATWRNHKHIFNV